MSRPKVIFKDLGIIDYKDCWDYQTKLFQKTVDLKIVDRDGNIVETSCRDIQSNRKVQINLEQYPKGVYLIQTKGETVQKTIKIIRE